MVSVLLSGRRQQKFLCMMQRFLNARHLLRLYPTGQLSVHHLMEMAQKTKARHIGTGVNVVSSSYLRGCFIQGGHGFDGFRHGLFRGLSHPVRRADDPHAQLFGKNQSVSGTSAVVGPDVIRVNQSHDRQAVFHIGIVDGMAPCQNASGLQHFFRSAPHNFSQDIQVGGFGEADNIESGFHFAAHGIDITQGIGRRDFPKGIGIVHHRRKKVQGLNHRCIRADAVNRRVVPAVIAHQKIRILRPPGQLFQDMA